MRAKAAIHAAHATHPICLAVQQTTLLLCQNAFVSFPHRVYIYIYSENIYTLLYIERELYIYSTHTSYILILGRDVRKLSESGNIEATINIAVEAGERSVARNTRPSGWARFGRANAERIESTVPKKDVLNVEGTIRCL